MTINYQKKGNLDEAIKLAKEGYSLFLEDDDNYNSSLNYAILVWKTNKMELASSLFQKTYKEYKNVNQELLSFELTFYKQFSDFDFEHKKYQTAWKHRNLFDSIYLILEKSFKTKEINELVPAQNIEIEQLKVNQSENNFKLHTEAVCQFSIYKFLRQKHQGKH